MLKFLQRYFLTGLLAISPLAITVWVSWQFYDLISANIRPWMERVPGLGDAYPEFLLTVMGSAVFVLLTTLIGMFTRNLIGMAFFRVLERIIEKIPVVKSVFSATKQISQVFLQDRRTAFQKVVVFEYPRRNLFSLGFVTRDEPGDDLVNVFLPTTPNPTSGYMLMVPRHELREIDVPVEEAIKLIISGGAVMTPLQVEKIGQETSNLSAAREIPEAGAATPTGEERTPNRE
jgi:uncharacterized membrane protein|nr:DUF502 domain-containing protein [Candidatus Krumholzibacteria bacterium]